MINTEEKLQVLNKISSDTLMEHLGILYTEIGEDYLVAEMPVTSKHYQPMRILHGGATLALAESVGSALSVIHIDMDRFEVKGMEINANHIRSVKKGTLRAKAKFIHKGRTSHIVEINICNEQDKLISICRLTNVVLKKQL
ncbi:hotdog fold thioesterase [Ancylomarina euxinus]|uniref:Hotdog fold thioesterase n=1 Tax=Ancylomarina euxinus TaxID=2283627 RepID=A0A425Y1P4_9BACT|nr:hotdog fold thioesterase [Ancylomarina euxinus]MCZ4695169.1 hotdog fold thioesterase [Ancylomarina euxinus]MUP14897.1 hotdog fold thioesterase [Ancylomarina euxinus]RRG21792.1 hotdog fold thioesterase [Ancylomarina euxinus]